MSDRAQSLLVDARGDWPSLLKHQRVFAACDDGALGVRRRPVTAFHRRGS
jgi:hypothetical protein